MKNEIEIWKDIVGYEGFYKVSNLGNVMSLERLIKYKNVTRRQPCKLLKKGYTSGYANVNLCKDGIQINNHIHVLVAETFLNFKRNRKLCINHLDGIKSNNNVLNLEICTHRENSIHGHFLNDKKTTSTYGICYRPKRNRYQLVFNKKYVGMFKTENEAYLKLIECEKEYINNGNLEQFEKRASRYFRMN